MAEEMVTLRILNGVELTKEMEKACEAIITLTMMGIILPSELPDIEKIKVRLGDYYIKNIKVEAVI